MTPAASGRRRPATGRRAAGRPRPRLDGPLGRAAQAVAAARRPASGCCATTGAATAARRRTTGRSGWTGRSPTSSRLLDGRPAVLFGHSYGGNVALAARRPAPRPRAGGRRLRDAAAVARRGGRTRPPAVAGARRASDDPAEAAERFMRRMIGDERWERLPSRTRAARRAEGAAMVGELVDLAAGSAVGPGAHHGAGGRDARQRRRRAPPRVERPPRRGARRLPGGRRSRAPATSGPTPTRTRSPPSLRRRWSAERGRTVTSRPKNVHVVSSVAPAASV